ncbi:MAG: hypothetical protein F6J93_22630 [Oscillatoria sp. SIO1A7]|nr:hypothetical protein [Oscillatoria sp. SIO1A7]
MKDAYTPLVSFLFSLSSPYTLHPTPHTLVFSPIPHTRHPTPDTLPQIPIKQKYSLSDRATLDK